MIGEFLCTFIKGLRLTTHYFVLVGDTYLCVFSMFIIILVLEGSRERRWGRSAGCGVNGQPFLQNSSIYTLHCVEYYLIHVRRIKHFIHEKYTTTRRCQIEDFKCANRAELFFFCLVLLSLDVWVNLSLSL